MEKVEDHEIQIPKGDRSKTILEPMVSDQWFVKTEELAKGAIKVVEDEDIKFIPKNWEKTTCAGGAPSTGRARTSLLWLRIGVGEN